MEKLKPFLLLLLISFLPGIANAQHTTQHITFKSLPAHINIPSEVQQIYQDRDGFLWFATRNGLCRFDGYELEIIKSNLYTPGILSSNDILTIHEDYQHRMWIGSSYGLNVLDKKTGRIEKRIPELTDHRIQSILVTSDSTIWVGTNIGLFRSKKEKNNDGAPETFERLRYLDVKSMVEAPDNQIWIGTWSHGIHRYIPAADSLITYPASNPLNSAYNIFKDSRDQIWIGSWGYGLYKLCNPYDLDNVYYEKYVHDKDNSNSIIHNLIYSISEDETTQTLWIGTLDGLSSFDGKDFVNYVPNESPKGLPYNEITTVFRDKSGIIWLGFLGGGVNWINPQNMQFNLHQITNKERASSCSNIQAITVFNDDLWLGLGNHGFMILDRHTFNISQREKEFSHSVIHSEFSYFSLHKPRNRDELWLGSFGNGIYVYRPGDKENPLLHLGPPQYPEQVYCIFEDHAENIYLGTSKGLTILSPRGEQFQFNNLLTPQSQYAHSIICVAQDSTGNVWIGTDHSGVFRLNEKVVNGKCTFTPYNIDNGKINSNDTQCLFVDKQGNLLVGTDGGGLSLYDPRKDTFVSIHSQYNIPGDMICSILEDDNRNMWLGSNVGLIKLNLKDSIADNKCRLYTTSDGLQDDRFIRGAACRTPEGEMFFGGHKGYNSFYPDKLITDETLPDIAVTDIQIGNQSLRKLPVEERLSISELMPEYTRTLRVNYKQNDLVCKLSVLNFTTPEKDEYAYLLEGFDNNWQYTMTGTHTISYTNLPSGTYTLYIKGTNGNGRWSEVKEAFTLVISPPWWASSWAYCIYTIIILTVVAIAIYTVRNRIKRRNAFHLMEIEKTKQEELNRAKLQFFTNITHELLTPLTILSVALNDIKASVTAHNDYFSIMDNNINRLKRLLQQILEFRKAESGNLKLRVSQGDIAGFIRSSVTNFLPVIRNKNMHLNINIDPQKISGYFDSDKIDKILYNLLSNAFKYNREGKEINVNIGYGASTDEIVISVSDNGEGIPEEKLTKLFSRFYEGDHRKYSTTGYGIGLSLTKDLVTLHHGRIEVESRVNEGTTFRVTLPIAVTAYPEDEIDQSILVVSEEVNVSSDESTISHTAPDESTNEQKKTILLVEDNEDLLRVIAGSLSQYYHILSATNGQEAIEQLEKTTGIVLVLSDIMMPVMNGIELCHYIKKQDNLLHIPIILLTAKNSESDMIEGYEAGADDYITKPFQFAVLLAKIKSLLKNKERSLKDYSNSIIIEMQKPDIDSSDKEFLQQAVDCVYKHLDDVGFSQQAFADAMTVSKSTLYRRLRTLTGDAPSAFISDIRLKTAYKIISDHPESRIADIAYMVGYNDPKYFSSCFKKKFGVLPKEL